MRTKYRKFARPPRRNRAKRFGSCAVKRAMKNRFVLAILAAVGALLLIFVNAVHRGASSSRWAKANGNTATAGNATAHGAGGDLGRPGKLETEKARRERMMSNTAYRDDFKLSEQDVYLYVQAKGSNALSLVSAFESTRDKEYLKTAAEKFPNDPFVQAKALMWLDMSDEERAKWIDAFKKSSPSNAFANFLAARDAEKRGDTQTAYAEVMAARGKGYDEFDRQSAEGLAAAYLSAGRSPAEAKTLGMSEVTLPQLAEFKKLGREFITLAEDSAVKGDTETEQEMRIANWQIGNRMRNGGTPSTIITELVGIAIENLTLRSCPPEMELDGRSAADLLAANTAATKSLRAGAPLFERWFPTAPEDEIITYMDTTLSQGEEEAVAWLRERHPELAKIGPPAN